MNQIQGLKITLLQQELFWEDIPANLAKFSALISSRPNTGDIIVLPEMFSTGFSMNAETYSQTMEGSAIEAMKLWSQNTNAAICGSLMIKDQDKFFNRFVWVEPNGKILTYDKSHLFRMGEEQNHYSKGTQRLLISYKGWKIAPFICYDLRFPVWLRRTLTYDYDLLLIVANWPKKRMEHWKALARARAIENQCYLVAVNRVGEDVNKMYHSGDSQIISPLGEVLFTKADEECVFQYDLNLEEITGYRNNFPAGLDADSFEFMNECNPSH